MWVIYLPKIVFRCFNLVAESFLISCIFNVDFLISCGFFVNILFIQLKCDDFSIHKQLNFISIWFYVFRNNVRCPYNTRMSAVTIFTVTFPYLLMIYCQNYTFSFLWVLSEFYIFRQSSDTEVTGKVIVGRFLCIFIRLVLFFREISMNFLVCGNFSRAYFYTRISINSLHI